MRLKAVLAFTLLALLVGGAAALAALAQPRAGAGGQHHVLVVGPAGTLFEGNVTAPNATALSALRATGLPLDVVEYPGMGEYVRTIGNVSAHGAVGWIFEVSTPSGWSAGMRSAGATPLAEGQAVRWRWSADA